MTFNNCQNYNCGVAVKLNELYIGFAGHHGNWLIFKVGVDVTWGIVLANWGTLLPWNLDDQTFPNLLYISNNYTWLPHINIFFYKLL